MMMMMITTIMILLFEFSHKIWLIIFYWSLSENKSPQISGTLLSILADLCNVAFWMVSSCPLISKSSSPSTNPLRTVPSTPITITPSCSIVFKVLWQGLRTYLSFCFLLILLCGRQNGKVHYSTSSLFFSLSLGLVFWPGFGHLLVSQNSRELCAFHCPGLCLYLLSVWSNLNFLHNS